MHSNSSEIDLLLNFSNLISKNNSLDELLPSIADFARNLLNADRCSVFIYDSKKQELWTKFAHGVEEIRLPATHGVVGHTALSQEIQIIVDAYNDFRFDTSVDKETGYKTDTILAVPMIDKNENTIGIFQAINKKNSLFTLNDAEVLQLLSHYAGSAIEKALLYDKLNDTYEKVAEKLSISAGYKDNESPLHTKRVGLYSELVAKKYGIEEEKISMLKIAAPMHDTGKVAIPEHIIIKQNKLDERDFALFKEHTTMGYKILYDEENELLKMAATIALEHHEKYDGSGYPNALKGDDISIYARITTLVDVFDSLSSKRSLQENWSFDETFDFIEHLSGKHFDPKLVKLFLESKDDIKNIFEQFRD